MQGILLPSVGSARHEDGGDALLDNPGKGALITTTNIFHKYLHWEFLLVLNQSRVYSYLLLDLPDMKMVATHF